MGIVRDFAMERNITTNEQLAEAVKNRYRVAGYNSDVVSKALYDALLKDQQAARRMLERYGLGHASAVEGIDALGRYAVAHGWDCEADLKEYNEWQVSVDDASHRTQ